MNKLKIGIIGGSGLDNPDILKNAKMKSVSTPFGNPSDVLIIGEIEGIQCVLLARHGRKHTIMPTNVNYRANIWALKDQGCTHILAATATGSLREQIEPGDVVVLDGFIDRTIHRRETFYDGEEDHPEGICHLPMEPSFHEKLRQVIISTADSISLPVHKQGTVITVEGPRFSSKAESLMYRNWGADVINMTTVPEVVLAKEAGICYAAIALATDYDCWKVNTRHVTVTEVLANFRANCSKVTGLIQAVVPNIAKENWDQSIQELKECVNNSIMH